MSYRYITYTNLRNILNQIDPYELYYYNNYDVYDPEIMQIVYYFNTINYVPTYEEIYDKTYNIIIINRSQCTHIAQEILKLASRAAHNN
jgi:hypothetical protein